MNKIFFIIISLCVSSVLSIQAQSSCPANRAITQNITSGSHNFLANNLITATNVISGSANVHYSANTRIVFKKGVRVYRGSHLVANLNGCGSTKSDDNISEIHDLHVNMYPNPSDGKVYIDLDKDTETFTVTITDVSGKTLIHKTINDNKAEFQLANYHKGMYMIKITTEKESYTNKLILR